MLALYLEALVTQQHFARLSVVLMLELEDLLVLEESDEEAAVGLHTHPKKKKGGGRLLHHEL